MAINDINLNMLMVFFPQYLRNFMNEKLQEEINALYVFFPCNEVIEISN